MRTFTIYASGDEAAPEPVFDIRATYTAPDRSRRFGALQVCTGWTRGRIVDKFLALNRAETAFLLAQELGRGKPVQVPMERNELIQWNH